MCRYPWARQPVKCPIPLRKDFLMIGCLKEIFPCIGMSIRIISWKTLKNYVIGFYPPSRKKFKNFIKTKRKSKITKSFCAIYTNDTKQKSTSLLVHLSSTYLDLTLIKNTSLFIFIRVSLKKINLFKCCFNNLKSQIL